jgi:hypothetical protein
MFCMLLGRVIVVVCRMQGVAMRNLRMMSGLFVAAGLCVLRSFAMMDGCVLVMFGGFVMVFVNVVIAHDVLMVSGSTARALDVRSREPIKTECSLS